MRSDPAAAISLLSAPGPESTKTGHFATADDLDTFAYFVAGILQDFTSDANIKHSNELHRLSGRQLYLLGRKLGLGNIDSCR